MKAYFSHDIFARENLKMKRLVKRWGMEGYGIFWSVVEFLHNNDNKINVEEIDLLASDLRIEEEKLESIIFDFKLFKVNNNRISSARVGENLKLQKEKMKKAKEAAMQRWHGKEDDANALPTQCESNAINEIKEKEKKEKEKKENENKKEEKKVNKKKETKEKNDENEKIEKIETEKTNENGEKSENIVDQSEKIPIREGMFYGCFNNVFLKQEHYDYLKAKADDDELLGIVTDELSGNISLGKEPEYDESKPESHFIRLHKYLIQKSRQSGFLKTASNKSGAKNSCRQNIPPNRALDEIKKINAEEGVPPPPEFLKAKEMLLKKIASRTINYM